jgi:nucleotide-binding universal stress UspA family protein
VTQAIPLMQRAVNVNVALFNAVAGTAEHGEQPGADIALYLARHGVKVDVQQQHTDTDIGNALLSLAADNNNDLVVMGGYGHTRLREVLLGGVTLTVLKTMTVPVLMAH